MRVLFFALVLFVSWSAAASRLQLAIATCDVESVRKLVDTGAEPSVEVKWLASNSRCNDDRALLTAKMLEAKGAKFEGLLVNMATRQMPKTLSFLTQKTESGDPTKALKAIARRDDLESVRVLLAAGADPLAGVALTSSLFDAAASGHEPIVAEMLKHVPDKQSPKVLAAYEIAKKQSDEKVAQVFLKAGVKPIEIKKIVARCERHDLTTAQTNLLKKMKILDNQCRFVQKCGDTILIDCNSAADGPAFYINEKTAEVLATCGGACMRGCTGCPPKEWTCDCKL